MSGKSVFIVTSVGGVVGSWPLPGERIDNFDHQQDLGWHIFFSLVSDVGPVTVVLAENMKEAVATRRSTGT